LTRARLHRRRRVADGPSLRACGGVACDTCGCKFHDESRRSWNGRAQPFSRGASAAALILLTGAGLLIRSNLCNRADAGFRPDHLMTMRLAPAPFKFRGRCDRQIQLVCSILRHVAARRACVPPPFRPIFPCSETPSYGARFGANAAKKASSTNASRRRAMDCETTSVIGCMAKTGCVPRMADFIAEPMAAGSCAVRASTMTAGTEARGNAGSCK
jgi:hypothetical protein